MTVLTLSDDRSLPLQCRFLLDHSGGHDWEIERGVLDDTARLDLIREGQQQTPASRSMEALDRPTCGWACGGPLVEGARWTGAAAYCRPCAKAIYGAEFRDDARDTPSGVLPVRVPGAALGDVEGSGGVGAPDWATEVTETEFQRVVRETWMA